MNNVESRLLTEDEFTDALFEYAKLNTPNVEKCFGNNKQEWLKLFTPQEFLTPAMKFRLERQDAKTASAYTKLLEAEKALYQTRVERIFDKNYWQQWVEETSDFLGEGLGDAIPLKLRRVLPQLIIDGIRQALKDKYTKKQEGIK